MHIISRCSALMGLGRPARRVAGASVAQPTGAGLGSGRAGWESGALTALRRVLKEPVPCPRLLYPHPQAGPGDGSGRGPSHAASIVTALCSCVGEALLGLPLPTRVRGSCALLVCTFMAGREENVCQAGIALLLSPVKHRACIQPQKGTSKQLLGGHAGRVAPSALWLAAARPTRVLGLGVPTWEMGVAR